MQIKRLIVLLSLGLGALVLAGAGCTQTADTTTNTPVIEVDEDEVMDKDDVTIEEDDTMEKDADVEVDEEVTTDDADSSDKNTNEEVDEVSSEDEDEEVTAEAETVSVTTVGNTFSPDDITITAGDAVEFDLGATHNAVQVSESTYNASGTTAMAGGFSVGFGETETVTFDEPGTYYYVCQPHVAMGMKGTIVVE